MKQFGLLILTVLLSLPQIQAQSKKAKVDMAFDKTVGGMTFHDYGSIVYGANGKVDFTYTNEGTAPLVITNVQSSCGCTVPTWPKEPVEPGKKGTITIVYNTTLPGVFNKTVVVYSNANNSPVRIEVRGKVNAQASDLKPGSKIDMQAGGANQVGESAAVMEADDSIFRRKAAFRAAAQAALLEKEQALKPKPANTGTAVKPAAQTATKQAAGTATKKN